MGLRDLAAAERNDKAKKGLRNLAELARAEERNLQADTSFFFQVENSFKKFLKSLNISKAAFLKKNDKGDYICCYPSGIDVASFKRLSISYDSLKSNFENLKSWTSFKDKELSIFRNFFASQEYICITEILLFSLQADEEFLMLIRSQSDKNNNEDFDFDNANSQLKEFIPNYMKNKVLFHSVKLVNSEKNDSMLEKVCSALNNSYTANMYRVSFKAIFPDERELEKNLNSLRIYTSIINKLISSIGSKNIAVLNGDLYLCIFSKQILAMDLYIEQIKKILESIYGNEVCERLIYESSSHSKNKEEILSFLNIKENDKASKDTFSV